MKKLLLTIIVALFACASLFASPVDVNRAMVLGQKFVKANFEQIQNPDLDLTYTVMSDTGEPCIYVFNVSDNGFILVSASDCVHPILGYSENNTFDINNVVPGLNFMMGEYKDAIIYAIENIVEAEPAIAAEWKSLENCGKVKPSMRGRGVGPLCSTKWNQDYPYNYYCPTAPTGPGGHVYAGCVATTMSQVMRYWNHPIQGTGSHSYYCPGYGNQSANFANTTYQWDNMPNALNDHSSQEEIEAVALLMYHCGVSVDMGYSPDGSGATSQDVPYAMRYYFGYAQSTVSSKTNTQVWNNSLRDAFDMGRPVYYAGCSPDGCHAFVCDGYDDNDLFHFNWGWGGYNDGYFSTDAIEFSSNQQAIMNIMPEEIYNNTAQAPTNFTVTPTGDNTLSATVNWTNPTKTLNNTNLPATIEKIVVERNGNIVHIEENVAPGVEMSFVDVAPCFSHFDYKVYAVIEGAHGAIAKADDIAFGPVCEWKLVLQSSAFQGMRGAYISLYDATGTRLLTATTTSSSAQNININVPLGNVYFTYTPADASQQPFTLTIIIKDSQNQTVYQYSGSSDELAGGVIFRTNNNCGDDTSCESPSTLYATADGDNVILTWEGVANPDYGYNIYRDGLLYRLVQETTFTDEGLEIGGHCYYVTVLCNSGESEATNESCANIGDNCNPPTDIWYELNPNNMKPKITWEKPVDFEGLSGYYIFRRTDDTDWTRVKLAGPNTTNYSDNSSLIDGTWYYYKVQAYYKEIDCFSAPAKNKYNDLEYYVKVLYSVDGVNENQVENVNIYPNPVNDNLTIDAKGIRNITIINLVGQKVFESSLYTDKAILNMNDFESGMYIIRVVADEYEITRRISVLH